MAKKEWIVTLHRKEDLQDFYTDMETPGGSLYIPDRSVSVRHRRNISRNTHYMLDFDEALMILDDPRVASVELAEILDLFTKPSGWTSSGEVFSKDFFTDVGDINWGLLRHQLAANISGWGDDATSNVSQDFSVTTGGKNVDVVIVDGHIDPAHPEFAVNSDGTGGTRVVQYNWLQHTNEVSGGANGTYVYTPYVDPSYPDTDGNGIADRTEDNNHGCHVAGTVAGNTQGWAREANIYNISPYSTNQNSISSSLMWDYIRAWHNSKPINSATGRRNPTVTNNSYGTTITLNNGDFGPVTRVIYRGVDYNPGRSLTLAELQARGFYATDTSPTVPYWSSARAADIQDAIDDGIIIVASAGNDSFKTVRSTNQDYNNFFYATYLGFGATWYLNRGNQSGSAVENVINVGATDNGQAEFKATFSNCGDLVDIFAAGVAIQSSLHTSTGATADPRNGSYYLGKYQGTSMSGPQVCGVLACLLEHYPGTTQAEAQAWLTQYANVNEMGDSGTDDPMDRTSLQGAPNLFLRWFNQRSDTGTAYPRTAFKNRPTSGHVYPRTAIRRRG